MTMLKKKVEPFKPQKISEATGKLIDYDLRPGEMLLNKGQYNRLCDVIKHAPKIPEGREVRELPHGLLPADNGWIVWAVIVIASIITLFFLT